MTDEAFARAFERGQITPSEFDHRAHVRLAWVYLREERSVDAALPRVRDAIRRFAKAAGVPEKYHETLTVVWMRLLHAASARVPASCDFAELLVRCPELGDRDLPLRYYSRDRLFSDRSRAAWVPPDRPL